MEPPQEQPQSDPSDPGIRPDRPRTRFELELEFVSMLSSPAYLNWLALNKYFQKPEFVEYLQYLQYWSSEPYIKYLTHPVPTLKVLELVQVDTFRRDIIRPDVVQRLQDEMLEAAAVKVD